jgi:hypothetical protein
MVTKKKSLVIGLASGSLIVALALLFSSSVAFGQADHVRWDIISLQPGTPPTITEGGNATALAEDGSEITLTGNGTFVAPGGGGGGSSAATGGGDWETRDNSGNVTGSGTYEVTGLVLWKLAPGSNVVVDLIGDPAGRSAGLAVLTIEYDDGDRGILVVSCHLVGTPDSVFEGVNASKSFVHYYDNIAPVAGTDANRTVFHVRQ